MSEQSLEILKQNPSASFKKEKETAKEGFYQALLKRFKKQQKRAARYLKKKHSATIVWLSQQKNDLKQIKAQAVQAAATGTVATAIFVATTAPIITTSLPHISTTEASDELSQKITSDELSQKIRTILKTDNHKPKPTDENVIAVLLSTNFGITVKSQFEGHRLNRTIGLIGAEQHLRRYPGDNLSAQLQTAEEKTMFYKSGMAPHKGAFGYFANSKQELTEDLVLKEKYYLAVQTFLIPGWKENWVADKDWFKFRKMLVYNPETGNSVVAVIADAGPAAWTGKHFGGSPEVMHELGLAQGPKKGEVIVMFIIDPENQVPLGPVRINNQNNRKDE